MKKIWKSIQNKDLAKFFRGFPWKTLHNAHKIGSYWESIPNREHGYEQNAMDSHNGRMQGRGTRSDLAPSEGGDVGVEKPRAKHE